MCVWCYWLRPPITHWSSPYPARRGAIWHTEMPAMAEFPAQPSRAVVPAHRFVYKSSPSPLPLATTMRASKLATLPYKHPERWEQESEHGTHEAYHLCNDGLGPPASCRSPGYGRYRSRRRRFIKRERRWCGLRRQRHPRHCCTIRWAARTGARASTRTGTSRMTATTHTHARGVEGGTGGPCGSSHILGLHHHNSSRGRHSWVAGASRRGPTGGYDVGQHAPGQPHALPCSLAAMCGACVLESTGR